MIVFFYLVNIFFLVSLVFLFWRQQKPLAAGLQPYFFPALALKLMCGIGLGFFYQYYYAGGGDTFLFQNQSLFLYDYFLDSPMAYLRLLLTDQFESETIRTSMVFVWYSNSYFMVVLLSLLNILTGGEYFLNALYFSFFSFFGSWQLVRALYAYNPSWRLAAVTAFLFFPSALFWSSGITKEAIYMGAMCWFLACLVNLVFLFRTSKIWCLVSLVAASYLLWKIKFYFAAVVFPLAISFALVHWVSGRFPQFVAGRKQLFIFLALLGCSGLLVSQMHVVFNIDYFLGQLMRSYQNILVLSAGKPVVLFPDLQPTIASVLAHAPLAAFHAIFRPFIWEGETWLYRFAGLENLGVSMLVVLALYYLVKHKPLRWNWFCIILLVYCLVIAAILGLTTPNIGTLSRYKTAFQPFLVFLLLTFLPHQARKPALKTDSLLI